VPGARPCHPGWGDRAQDCHTHRVCCARPLQSGSHRLEVRQCSGEVVDDLPGDHLGCGEVVEVLQRGVLEPGGVEVGLVPRDELVVAEGAEPLTLHALLPALGPNALMNSSTWLRRRGLCWGRAPARPRARRPAGTGGRRGGRRSPGAARTGRPGPAPSRRGRPPAATPRSGHRSAAPARPLLHDETARPRARADACSGQVVDDSVDPASDDVDAGRGLLQAVRARRPVALHGDEHGARPTGDVRRS
jgi:hypothetical protein